MEKLASSNLNSLLNKIKKNIFDTKSPHPYIYLIEPIPSVSEQMIPSTETISQNIETLKRIFFLFSMNSTNSHITLSHIFPQYSKKERINSFSPHFYVSFSETHKFFICYRCILRHIQLHRHNSGFIFFAPASEVISRLN